MDSAGLMQVIVYSNFIIFKLPILMIITDFIDNNHQLRDNWWKRTWSYVKLPVNHTNLGIAKGIRFNCNSHVEKHN